MDFDLSKLNTDHNKPGEVKAKPRFGPAARAVSRAAVFLASLATSSPDGTALIQRPKPQAKPVEQPARLDLDTEPQPQGVCY